MARVPIAADLFPYTNGNLNASGNWLDLNPSWATIDVNGQTVRAVDSTVDTPSRWSGADANLFTADQFFELMLAAGSRGFDTAGYRIGGVLRPSGQDATRSYYLVYMINDNDIGQNCTTRVTKVVNGAAETVLSSTSMPWADLDVISAEIVTVGADAQIRVFKGATLITALGTAGVITDSSSPLTSASPSGIHLMGDPNRPIGDAWVGGNVTGSGGAVIPLFTHHLRQQGIA